MNTAVITIASGRHGHLRHQRDGLSLSTLAPDVYVVVAMNDPWFDSWSPEGEPRPRVVAHHFDHAGLPLAAARNIGAARAIADGADLLVFVDVDCIPAPDTLAAYANACHAHPAAILMGAVGYLPEGTEQLDPSLFSDTARFHDFRPRLASGNVAPADPRLFWSLSFALASSTWLRIGGFCEQYRGYGGEDTDFGQLATTTGTELLWLGGAEAFHQYHATSSPPTAHVDDIVANATLFKSRWGFWPMEGWLREFRDLGLVEWHDESESWHRTGVPA